MITERNSWRDILGQGEVHTYTHTTHTTHTGTDRAIEHMSMLREKRKGEKREREKGEKREPLRLREEGAFEDAEGKTISIYKPF